MTGSRALAQTEATELTALGVELWPDYDREAMLVLLTGTLSPATTLPATVAIPLPPGADVHAVARFTSDNQLLADVEYTEEGEQLIMTLPDQRFRVEYYAPYDIQGDQRSYDFNWLSGLAVDQLSVAIQQPGAAETMTIDPEPVDISSNRGDGLLYHSLASQIVPAGEQFTVSIDYTTPTGALSALPATDLSAVTDTASTPSSTPVETGRFFDNFDPLWLLLLVVAVALIGLALYISRQQTSSNRVRKPAPNRASKPSTTSQTTSAPRAAPKPASPLVQSQSAAAQRFCHHC
ncbi:MAG: hypothetical protein R3C44_25275, partial [Chloroflexota bacterium]